MVARPLPVADCVSGLCEGTGVRISVYNILTGETRYFREWALLASYLTSKLDPPDADASQPTEPAG